MKNEEKKEKIDLEEKKAVELSDDALDEVAGGVMTSGTSKSTGATSRHGAGGKPIIGASTLGGPGTAGTSGLTAGTSGLTAGTSGLTAGTSGVAAGTSGTPSVAGTESKPGTAGTSGLDTPGLW